MLQLSCPVVRRVRELAGNVVVLSLSGDVDLNASPALRQDLLSVADAKPSKVVLEMAGVSYMDSSGISALVELMQRLKRSRGDLVLCALAPRVRGILDTARLDKVFTIKLTEAEALA